jgi:hypothetical protein
MNDLDLLRSLGTDLEPADSPLPPSLQRLDVTGKSGRSWSMKGSGVAMGLSAAATVAAVTLVATGALSGSTTGEPVTAAPAAPGSASTGSAKASAGGTTASTKLNGSQVLLLAAERSAAGPATTGKYWRVQTESHDVERAKVKGRTLKIDSGLGEDLWYSSSAARTERLVETQSPPLPADSKEEAIWKRAGSPKKVDVYLVDQNGESDVWKATLGATSTQVIERPADRVRGQFRVNGHWASLKEVRQLPSDPTKLRKAMLKEFAAAVESGKPAGRAGKLAEDADDWTQDRWLFSNASEILTLPVTPAVRSAVYQILADLPHVRNLGPSVDRTGRTGNTVAISWRGPVGQQEDRMIIDDRTGLLLATESRILKPIKVMSWIAPSDAYASTVYTRAEWTDATPPKATVTFTPAATTR